MKFISRNGRAISEKKWRAFRQDASYCKVAEDRIGDVYVSTLWWGLDSGLGVFDTWICGGKLHDTHYAHTTQAEAKAGHAKIVSSLTAEADPLQSVVFFSSAERQPQLGGKAAI